MTEKALVSIALCTYNGEKYLREQVDTLVNQSYPNLEIVVVDDSSTDSTCEIVRSYQQNFPFVKLYQNEDNLGYVKNFEKAISLCQGEFIALSDQDDIWDLNKIQLLVDNIGDNLLIYHDSEFVDEERNSLNRKMSDVREFYSGRDSRVFLLENCVSGHAMLFRKKLAQDAVPFNKNIFHDWWLSYVATCNGGITFSNKCLVKYRQHNNANTNILRQDRGVIKKSKAIIRLEKDIYRIEYFETHTKNVFSTFNQKFIALLKSRLNTFLSPTLLCFVLKHKAELLFIQKKSTISKLNYCLKFLWGLNLKR
jgi:glycosyltransferase involved in cell wall biosynthesis